MAKSPNGKIVKSFYLKIAYVWTRPKAPDFPQKMPFPGLPAAIFGNLSYPSLKDGLIPGLLKLAQVRNKKSGA